jgi:N-dimethylarginine dimethylaminohydrolase
LPLALADRRFLHLDMVVGNVAGRGLLVFWEGLNPVSQRHLRRWAGDKVQLISVSEDDARRFACNSIAAADGTLITGPISDRLAGEIGGLGLNLERLDLSEFYKAGGGAKCLTLPLSWSEAPQV